MFGHLVARHWRRLSMSQEELAHLTGLSERSIRRLESGDVRAPRPATVRLLADAFGLSAPDRDVFITADGRLFHTERGGKQIPLSTWRRVWTAARNSAFTPEVLESP